MPLSAATHSDVANPAVAPRTDKVAEAHSIVAAARRPARVRKRLNIPLHLIVVDRMAFLRSRLHFLYWRYSLLSAGSQLTDHIT